MTEIQNPKQVQDIENEHINVLVIEYCNLFVIWRLLFEISKAHMSSAIDTVRSASIFT